MSQNLQVERRTKFLVVSLLFLAIASIAASQINALLNFAAVLWLAGFAFLISALLVAVSHMRRRPKPTSTE